MRAFAAAARKTLQRTATFGKSRQRTTTHGTAQLRACDMRCVVLALAASRYLPCALPRRNREELCRMIPHTA